MLTWEGQHGNASTTLLVSILHTSTPIYLIKEEAHRYERMLQYSTETNKHEKSQKLTLASAFDFDLRAEMA